LLASRRCGAVERDKAPSLPGTVCMWKSDINVTGSQQMRGSSYEAEPDMPFEVRARSEQISSHGVQYLRLHCIRTMRLDAHTFVRLAMPPLHPYFFNLPAQGHRVLINKLLPQPCT
jgi:hypothetical protein